MSTSNHHIPVLLHEVIDCANANPNDIVIDCTFGRGGYSQYFLEAGCFVTALDRDPDAAIIASKYKDRYKEKFNFIQTEFSALSEHFTNKYADIILFDIGVSSPQIDNPQRGFSFQKDGPLDMRMGDTQRTAADIINHSPQEELADIFYYLGEERASRKYARLICEHRVDNPFTTTLELANFIRQKAKPVPRKKGRKVIHPATLIFQALRIAVNDELEEFKKALDACTSILKPDGRLVMVTFHSLEDRIAKEFSKQHSFMPKQSKYAKEKIEENLYVNLTKKPVTAGPEETSSNPRASSAKLRGLRRTQTLPPVE